MDELFKRINFFKGFFTQAEDWQAAQDYHIEKRKIHNRYLHTPGVVYGLEVKVATGGIFLEVSPGYAIDGKGRDLYLPNPEKKKKEKKKIPIDPQSFKPPVTVYVVIRYHEKKIDKRKNLTNPEYTDHAFIEECPIVDITPTKPKDDDMIELARIEISKNATAVRDAEDSSRPVENEVDLTHIKKAGVVTGIVVTLEDLGRIVRDGETSVVASKDLAPGEEDSSVSIEKIRKGDLHRYYLVSAYPIKNARILWYIGCISSGNGVEYRLYFRNFSDKAVNVAYKIFRLI